MIYHISILISFLFVVGWYISNKKVLDFIFGLILVFSTFKIPPLDQGWLADHPVSIFSYVVIYGSEYFWLMYKQRRRVDK